MKVNSSLSKPWQFNTFLMKAVITATSQAIKQNLQKGMLAEPLGLFFNRFFVLTPAHTVQYVINTLGAR